MNDLPIIEKKLGTGLRAVLLPRAEVQTVTFMVLIGVGSRYETPRQSGLSHFLEHMFFKGTSTRPTTKEIAEAIDSIGGESNAFTGEEYTGYYVKVAAAHLATGAEVVADILLRPLFDRAEIERERGVIIEEIRMYNDTPMRHVQNLWQTALFGDHPLGRDIVGTEATVSAFSRRDFVNYTKKHYHTKNAVVAVSGKFDPDRTVKLLRDLFAALPAGEETMPKAAPRRSPAHRFYRERRASLDQTHFVVGAPAFSLHDERRWPAYLLALILGGGMSSRLFLSVRERHGLAYAVRTSSDAYTDTGSFATQVGARTDKAALALQLVLQEYDQVQAAGVTEEELHKAKEMARGRLVMDLEETNALAVFAGGQLLLEKHIMTPAEMWAKLTAVTRADVQQAARELLAPERLAAALLSPHASTKVFEKAFGSLS